MKKALIALALLLCTCRHAPATAPVPRHAPELHSTKVWIDSAVQDRLRRDWDSVNPDQLERKYCMTYRAELDADGDSAFTITAAVPAFGGEATPQSISAECPREIPTPGVPSYIHFTAVHIHTPTTCDLDEVGNDTNCHMGGRYAWECFPSTADWKHLVYISKFKFALIQCGPDEITPYFIHPYWWK